MLKAGYTILKRSFILLNVHLENYETITTWMSLLYNPNNFRSIYAHKGYRLGCFCENRRKSFFRNFMTFTMITGKVMQSSIRNFQITHKYHINTAITGTCIKQSFTISYMHKFICMLKANKKVFEMHT
ncbi:hypothetical protein T05_16516 [Trichinella murrelli]|uniref:Uncharacterized protein n=1 Tax=Trichinella murrelli TaxID=144512 RepID=A0A0V0U138_9BILA|nr:hypothetical protein T05_16516 [Trichinella murrelli]